MSLSKQKSSLTNEKGQLKTYHATMAVTRLEEWCVEAKTLEEAKSLLAAGQGHRCHLGDCLHIDLDEMMEPPGHR